MVLYKIYRMAVIASILAGANLNEITAMEEKKDLYLVVGSTRSARGALNPIVDALHGQNVDLSLRNTFDSNATTMDVEKCKIEDAKHIVGDARNFKFSDKYNIKVALLERLPTCGETFVTEDTSDIMELLLENYIGACIKQISTAMQPGADLLIEWHPYVTLSIFDQSTTKNLLTQNPFNGFIDMNVALQGAFLLGGDNNLHIFPSELATAISKMAAQMENYLNFYHQKGAETSMDRLIKRVYWEAYTILHMSRKGSMVFIDYDPRNDDVNQLIEVYKNQLVKFMNFPPEYVGEKVGLKNKDGLMKIGIIYDLLTFQTSSFFNFLLSDIAVENNIPYALEYMESIDFKGARIERKQNFHNGRENVWMIEAKKGK